MESNCNKIYLGSSSIETAISPGSRKAVTVIYLSREDSHLFQVVSNSKFVSVGVQSPIEINAPRGCAVIL